MNTLQDQYRIDIPDSDKNLTPVAHYNAYNERRYGTPWIAPFDAETKRPNFALAREEGGYTGGYNTGNAGYLTVIRPHRTRVFAYGQKDYRGCREAGSYNIAIVSPDGDVVTMSRAEYIERAFVAR